MFACTDPFTEGMIHMDTFGKAFWWWEGQSQGPERETCRLLAEQRGSQRVEGEGHRSERQLALSPCS